MRAVMCEGKFHRNEINALPLLDCPAVYSDDGLSEQVYYRIDCCPAARQARGGHQWIKVVLRRGRVQWRKNCLSLTLDDCGGLLQGKALPHINLT